MSNFVIEKGVAAPEALGQGITAALRLMDVGDSIMIAGAKPTDRVLFSFREAAKRMGRKISCRKNDNGVRIWRIQ